jgi:ribonucleoside-diphosphate reductase alpha chain
MFERVARCLAFPEKQYGDEKQYQYWYKRILDTMLDIDLMPASPYLFNCRNPEEEDPGGLFSCFVLPIEDSIDGIYKCMAECALVYQKGGGVGIDFSPLRENGALVVTNKGNATGPLSFMEVFDTSSKAVEQGGVRRGASIAFLDINHCDIESFIAIKSQNLPEIKRLMRLILTSTDQTLKKFAQIQLDKLQNLTQFNLSVKLTDAFMEAVEKNSDWKLISKQNGRVSKVIKARKLFNMICEYAWKSGDPGVCFIDTVNKDNKLPQLGRIEASNPCGELYMHPYHACNLIAINLNRCMTPDGFKFHLMESIVKTAVRMGENAIDMSAYPLPQIEKAVKATRGIGIGLMGFADILADLRLPYDSESARGFLDEICGYLRKFAVEASEELAHERGVPANWAGSVWEKEGKKVRNLWHTTLQPTGSVAIISGVSHSIEPYFNVFYNRRTYEGAVITELNWRFKRDIENAGLDIDHIVAEIAKTGSIQNIESIPDEIKSTYRCAADVSPENHIKMQAAAQRHIDAGISKTINMKPGATVADVAKSYKLAHQLGCKGTTIFREGSKTGVLSVASVESKYHEELRKFLLNKYVREGLTARAISDILGVSEQVVFAKLKRFGIRKGEEHTAQKASELPLDETLTDIILANVLVGHSKVTTVDHQSSFRLVADHLVYAQSVRAKFLEQGIQCSEIMTIVTDKTYYYFDTGFLKDIYDLPVDYDSVIDIKTKSGLRELVTPYFLRHMFLVGGVNTGRGGIKFTSNSRNANVLMRFAKVFSEETGIDTRTSNDDIYVPKAAVEDFHAYLESGAEISAESQQNALCPDCGSMVVVNEKCRTCPNCGWGQCSI